MISVIVPVFNTKQYLERSIESVLRQTYQNWELILVDDGSSDGSEAVCDFYTGKDSRIRVIHQDNKGAPAARNTGMKHALGGYLFTTPLFLPVRIWLSSICNTKEKTILGMKSQSFRRESTILKLFWRILQGYPCLPMPAINSASVGYMMAFGSRKVKSGQT